MRKILFIIFLLTTTLVLQAQNLLGDGRFIKTWRPDEMLGTADTISLDTTHINFNDKNPTEGLSIANSYNSNFGSPIQSKIYMKRSEGSDFMFEDVYRPYTYDVKSLRLYDVNFPYTHLKYLSGGPTGQKEEQIKFFFSASPSKKFNVGFNMDYIYSVGMFRNQAAQRFGADLFGRYDGKHYSAIGMVAVNNHKNHENGGLTDLSMLNNPSVDVLTKDMPIALQAYSAFNKNSVFYHHNYSVGFNREIKDEENDTILLEFVPVTRFGHTFKFEEMKKRYYEPKTVLDFYEHTFNPEMASVNDTAALRTMSNLFSINLAEEFNHWLKFGATAYVENEIQQFAFRPDSLIEHSLKSNTRVGGRLSKLQGEKFRYNFLGDIYLIGYKLGEFRLEGRVDGSFNLLRQKVELTANAFVRNETPSFFLQNYHSAHFRWENNFTKIYKTHLSGQLSLPDWRTRIHGGVENLTHFVYFNEKGVPVQHDGNVQILSLDLRQDFKVKSITLENNAVYQLSSNQNVVPLPALTLYHNLYYSGKWFVDLYPQFGVSVRYHTKYFAPSYIPAIAQFHNQNQIEIGDYPEIKAYANFHLKSARLFAEYNNIGSHFLKGWGFYMPNYPINPPIFKFGVLWNFFN